MDKDFFDEEFEKKEKAEAKTYDEEQRRRQIDEWYANAPANNGGGSGTSNANSKRPLYIVLVCVALVLALVLGWVLCAVFAGPSQTQNILDEVIAYLDTEYYKEVPDEKMLEAIAAGGTAILQTAGDQFSKLMTPQQFYDFYFQVDNTQDMSSPQGYFGMSYSPYGIGLYVSDVATDSSCYGVLQSGDVIIKFSDMLDENGQPVELNGEAINQLVVADSEKSVLDYVMQKTCSANFHFLRDGEVMQTGVLSRGAVGFAETNYDFSFVEFYFNDRFCNVSFTNQNNAQHNTFELRMLNKLPADTGYVRIDQFMYYLDDENREVTAATEFRQVMQLFKQLGLKRLVLDLKGNPGGSVDAVSDIAGMLVCANKLSAEQQKAVTKSNKLLITSLVPRNEKSTTYEYRTSTYGEYFGTPSETCDIVVWTDGGSASASELLTGALTDYRTGFQMGTRTYGKGIAQRVVPLQQYTAPITPKEGDTINEFYWAIYYTFAAYYSPLGTNIHGVGYKPAVGYDNLTTYEQLWNATYTYWGIS